MPRKSASLPDVQAAVLTKVAVPPALPLIPTTLRLLTAVSSFGSSMSSMKVPVTLLDPEDEKPNSVELPRGVLVPLSRHEVMPEPPVPVPLQKPCSVAEARAGWPSANAQAVTATMANGLSIENLVVDLILRSLLKSLSQRRAPVAERCARSVPD